MAAQGRKSHEDNASVPNFSDERAQKEDHVPSDQVLTLAIREKSLLQTGSSNLSPNREVGNSEPTGNHEISNEGLHEVMMNGEVGSPQSRGMASKVGGKDSSVNNGNKSFAFGPRGQDNGSLKVFHGSLNVSYLVNIDYLFVVSSIYCIAFSFLKAKHGHVN